MPDYTYEESVKWMREQPDLGEHVKHCYLDEDNSVAAQRFALSEEFAEVVDLLRARTANKTLRILDLGCGNGIASYAFAALGHEVYSVDPDESTDVGLGAAARLSKLNLKGSIEVRQSFAESLPFEDGFFDRVYARQALHHLSDLEQGLAQCARVLKKPGMMLATREHVLSDETQLKEFLDNHILHKLHKGENAYLLEKYVKAFENGNFQVLKILAPFDSVINHFPTTNQQLKTQMTEAMTRKFGALIANSIANIDIAEKLYRRRLSGAFNMPGKLYSFLCQVSG